jgi:hypothetical protein
MFKAIRLSRRDALKLAAQALAVLGLGSIIPCSSVQATAGGIGPTLVPEAPPPGTPQGFKAYRLRDPVQYYPDVVVLKSITYTDGQVIYEIAPIKAPAKVRVMVQDPKNLKDSHVLIEPGGFVDPRFLAAH